MRLAGLDQWVMIRGVSFANPPLILLHGGPGFTVFFFLGRRDHPGPRRNQHGLFRRADRTLEETCLV